VLAEELVAAHGHTNMLNVPTDVSKVDEVVRLRGRVYEVWGVVSVVRHGLPSPLPKKGIFSLPPLPSRGAFPVPTPLILVFRLPYCSRYARYAAHAFASPERYTRCAWGFSAVGTPAWITGRP
jgi:hypothetical protein